MSRCSGITLKSIDRLEEIPDKRVYKELSDNMKTGVPEIIIKQSDVKMPLRQLERVMKRAAGWPTPRLRRKQTTRPENCR